MQSFPWKVMLAKKSISVYQILCFRFVALKLWICVKILMDLCRPFAFVMRADILKASWEPWTLSGSKVIVKRNELPFHIVRSPSRRTQTHKNNCQCYCCRKIIWKLLETSLEQKHNARNQESQVVLKYLILRYLHYLIHSNQIFDTN